MATPITGSLHVSDQCPAPLQQTSVLQNEMSAVDQKRTLAVQEPMSALPLKADMCGATRDVRFGPKADIGLTSDECSDARQDNPDFGELARLRIDLD